MRRIRTRLVTGLVVGVIVATTIFGSTSSADTTVTTTNGTWTAHPGSASLNQTAVQQPINADGTSNFKGGKGVIPVKFSLSQGTGPFVFQSIFSDNTPPNPNTANDYSFLSWRSATPLTFADITRLSAIYAFTDGDCAGGSLRWSVRLDDDGTTRNLDIHYQPGAGGIGQQTCAPGTSGANLIGSTDTIYVTQQFNGTHSFPSAYNNTYADALAELGSLTVVSATLALDSGWGANGDQVVALTSATVGTAGFTDTFTPPASGTPAQTCDLPEASIRVTKVLGTSSGAVNEPVTIQPQDDNDLFRVVDCKYMYNLAASSLSGAGTYKVEVVINGVAAGGAAYFDLR